MRLGNTDARETASIRDFPAIKLLQRSAVLSLAAGQGIFDVKFAANAGKNRDTKKDYSHAPAHAAGDIKPVVNNL